MDAFAANGPLGGEADQAWLNAGGTQGATPGTFVASGQTFPQTSSRSVALGDVGGDNDLDAVSSWVTVSSCPRSANIDLTEQTAPEPVQSWSSTILSGYPQQNYMK